MTAYIFPLIGSLVYSFQLVFLWLFLCCSLVVGQRFRNHNRGLMRFSELGRIWLLLLPVKQFLLLFQPLLFLDLLHRGQFQGPLYPQAQIMHVIPLLEVWNILERTDQHSFSLNKALKDNKVREVIYPHLYSNFRDKYVN